MKIDLSIYDRILYGDLRPWLDTNKSETKFQTKLTPSFRYPKGGSIGFEKAIKTALQDFKALTEEEDYFFEIKDDNTKFQSLQDEISEPLLEIHLPEPPNKKTEFYFFLIRNEGTRLMNNLLKALQLSTTESEKKYSLNSVLNKVNAFLNDIEKQKKQLQKTQTTAQQKSNDYILLVLKYTLIRLHLEMKAIFEPLLGAKAFDETGIFENILKETPPEKSIIKDNVGLNDFKVKHYINFEKYDKSKTLELINETLENSLQYFPGTNNSKEATKRKAVLAENIQALENLYFIREFDFSEENTNYETLISKEYNEEVFSKVTQVIAEKIEEHKLPNKRLAVIAKEEQQLSFLQTKNQGDESVFTLSIPRRIIFWLSGNKNFINANLHLDFSKFSESNTSRIKTNLSVPQVALLFQMLNELKPDIFQFKTKAELFRFIKDTFETKQSKEEGISIEKLGYWFNNPEIKVADFWETHLRTMIAFLKKIQKPL